MLSTKNPFKNLSETPPQELAQTIITHIEKLEYRKSQRQLFAFGGLTGGALLLFIPLLIQTISSFTNSGFLAYFDLAFSDGGVVLSHWQTFAMSLLDALPITEIALLLGVSVLLTAGVRALIQTIQVRSKLSSMGVLA